MAGIGLQGAYGAAGAQDALQQLLARRMEQEAIQRQMKQQEFENSMREKQFQSTEELERAQLEDISQNRQASQQTALMGRAATLADQLPSGTALAPTDPAVGVLRTGGQGSLLTHQDPTLASTQYDGASTLPGASKPAGFLRTTASPGNPEQYIKGASFTQASKATEEKYRADTFERQEERDAEIARHNVAMENKPSAMSTVVVQGPEGPMLADKRAGTARPITTEGGETLGFAPTQQQRNTKAQYTRARPILSAISDLSEKINTGQGAIAKVSGGIARAAAQANLNDDVAEYEAMISGFTPLIARALGHTGVLTEQDVRSVKAMFPRPGDSKSLRDRKVARIEQLMGAIESGGDTQPGSGAESGTTEYDFVGGKLVPRGESR